MNKLACQWKLKQITCNNDEPSKVYTLRMDKDQSTANVIKRIE